MGHVSRSRKLFPSSSSGYGSTPAAERWLKIRDDVEKVCSAMEDLARVYGWDVLGVAVNIYHENMPGEIMEAVERYRYWNTKLVDGNKATRIFRP